MNGLTICPHCDGKLTLKCLRCGWEWVRRSRQEPRVCPNRSCKSPYWNRERVKSVKPKTAWTDALTAKPDAPARDTEPVAVDTDFNFGA